jgi:hypothetical protein
MGASKKFQVGDRVVPSEEGVKRFSCKNGIVVGFDQHDRRVRIQCDGQRRPRTFPPNFWFVCNWITLESDVPRMPSTKLRQRDLRSMAVLAMLDNALIE